MEVRIVEDLCRAIDNRSLSLFEADRYYVGSQPLAFLSPAARKSLGDRLTALSANYVKLATDSLAERLTVDGFNAGGQSLEEVWADWESSGMTLGHKVAILECLVLGQSFLMAWADSNGEPVISVESPREMAITRHPISREITFALKRWIDEARVARAVLFESDRVSLWAGPEVPEGGAFPATGWSHSETVPNPLGVVPVVALTNSQRLLDTSGTPEAQGIWPLVDALSKLLSDVMVASEATALPRRWAAGLAIETDANGVPVNPFSLEPGSVWQSEDGNTKFGQFPEPHLAGYEKLIEIILRQIGSISGLPDHLVGFRGEEPNSAEQIRASESSLVARAYSHQTSFGPSFARVAALTEAIRTGGRVRSDISTVWKSPESRTKAAEADAAAKLYSSGILPLETVWSDLGYSPEQISDMRSANLRSVLDRAPLTLPEVGQ